MFFVSRFFLRTARSNDADEAAGLDTTSGVVCLVAFFPKNPRSLKLFVFFLCLDKDAEAQGIATFSTSIQEGSLGGSDEMGIY